MNSAIRGAMISAFIMPGLGHIALFRYKRGACILLTVLSILAATVIKAVQQALVILQKIEATGETIETTMIFDTVVRVTGGASSRTITVATLLLVAVWLFSVVDAYRIGKESDRKASDHLPPDFLGRRTENV